VLGADFKNTKIVKISRIVRMDNLSAAIYPPFLTRGFNGFYGVYPASFPYLPRGGDLNWNQVAE